MLYHSFTGFHISLSQALEMSEKRKKSSGECHLGVKINVGGTISQTSFLTLTRLDNTVLDYLRDGDNFALPLEEDVREAIRKEAEFYNIHGLANICSDEIKVGHKVQWKDSIIEEYWKYLVRYLYDHSSSETKMCMACACFVTGFVGPTSRTRTKTLYNPWSEPTPSIKYEEWGLLKHHMRTMKGTVVEVYEQCCHVTYSSALQLHLPKSALRLSR